MAIGLLRLTGGAAARAVPAMSTPLALPQGRSLLQSSNSLDSTVFAPLVAPAPRGNAAPVPAPFAPAPAPASAPAPAPLSDAAVADYCDWLFEPATDDLDVALATEDLASACRDQLGNNTEPLTYLQRERAAGAAPGAGNFTRISVLAPDQGFANLTLANHTFGGVLANITARARAYVSPFWPRAQGPISDGFIGTELIRPNGAEASHNTTQSWFDWLFGQKLAHRNPFDNGFAPNDPDLIGNIPGLSQAISADSQRVSPGLALNRWIDAVNAPFSGLRNVSPWPNGRAYNATGDWASGTGALLGDVTARPQLFVDRYRQLPATLGRLGLSQESQNATLTAYRNLINYGLYNLGQPTL